MNKKQTIKQLSKIYQISRKYPVIGAEKLLNVDLPYYQQDMLERMWATKFPLLLCSRRTGKTFITAVFITLKCLLYKGMEAGIVAPVFRQSQTVFKEIENLYKRSPLFQSEVIDRPKHGNSSWYIEMRNGSSIEALPLSDNIRSKGYNIIHIDEYGYQSTYSMNEMTERVLEPMIFTKREGADKEETDIGNQLIISSTATFKWNDYYDKYLDYKEKIEEGDNDYDIISYDFIDGIKGGKFEEKISIDKFRSSDPLTRKMEYLNIFPDDTDGFITYKLLNDKAIDKAEKVDPEKDAYQEPKTTVEFEQEYDRNNLPKHKYIMTFDDADTGNSNFAVALIKLDGKTKRLVRVEAMNSAFIDEKVKLIRDLLRKFNVVLIAADQRNKNIKDNLAKPYTYKDGKKGSIIVDMDDKEQMKYVKREYGENADIKKLIKIHNFSNSSNEQRARHFLSEIEKGRFKIPADPREGYKSKKEEDAYNEIKQALHEITSIKIQANRSVVRYEPEDSNQPTDRWTVCELGCFMADQYLKDSRKTNTDEIVLGKWK